MEKIRRIGFNLAPTSTIKVYLLTALGTLVCIAIAMAIDSYSFEAGWALEERWINNIIIPLVLAPPFFYLLLSKQRQLSLAHRDLLAIASTDPLTNCLNRRAFSTLVEAYLERFDDKPARGDGSLLILDVDHFKAVNDRFGHDIGDEALKLIADLIKANVRELDLVARLGGEEFGVFLPGLDPGRTQTIAERIRAAVQAASFAPVGERHALSLSIGGVTFSPPVTFPELYRDADKRLYAAKHAGRNRVDIVGHGTWLQQPVAGVA